MEKDYGLLKAMKYIWSVLIFTGIWVKEKVTLTAL